MAVVDRSPRPLEVQEVVSGGEQSLVLVGELDLSHLTPEQQRIVVRLEDLAHSAKRAVGEYRGRAADSQTAPTPMQATAASLAGAEAKLRKLATLSRLKALNALARLA